VPQVTKKRPKAAKRRRESRLTLTLGASIRRLKKLEAQMNAKVTAVVTALAATRTEVRRLTNVKDAIRAKLQADAALIASLRAQLDALIAQGTLSAEDSQALQDVSDGLSAITNEADTDLDGIEADITANTGV
jgi:uncharacterized protein involved in exopolysaccharide biosynthesis